MRWQAGCHYLDAASITVILSSLYRDDFQLHADELLQSRQHLLNQPKNNKHKLIYGGVGTQIEETSKAAGRRNGKLLQ